jgi:signal transduction histidine kinase
MDYFIAMFEDTTAEHHADVAAARNLNVLERLNRLKTEFLTMVRHEFRTALVGIQGFSELMRDAESLNLAEVKSFANEVYNDARRLDQMLDKMLDLDRSVDSQTVLHIGRTSLNSAVYDAVAILVAEGLKHHLVTNLDPALPQVNGDGTKLRQLLSILFSNAMKFSSEGSEVVVSTRAESGHVHVTVKDHGTGMPNDFDQQLFGRHQSSADNPTTDVMGTGLGLPMAREIVELHGGKIWFDNVVGGGSEFHFTIPIATQPAPVA